MSFPDNIAHEYKQTAMRLLIDAMKACEGKELNEIDKILCKYESEYLRCKDGAKPFNHTVWGSSVGTAAMTEIMDKISSLTLTRIRDSAYRCLEQDGLLNGMRAAPYEPEIPKMVIKAGPGLVPVQLVADALYAVHKEMDEIIDTKPDVVEIAIQGGIVPGTGDDAFVHIRALDADGGLLRSSAARPYGWERKNRHEPAERCSACGRKT